MKKIKNKGIVKKREIVSDLCLFCDAPCCKENFVPLSYEEVKSKKYEMVFESIFNFKDKKIEAGYFLKRKDDGSCIYLNDFDMCSIWRDRPESCRIYFCERLKKP
ncbi:YkgJ family cysteine cluster protein [bacterium]|nr:YkgJ family cysteine cluster protein [bacterium]